MVAQPFTFQDQHVLRTSPDPPALRERGDTFPALRTTHLWLSGAEFALDTDDAGDDVRSLLLASVAAGCVDDPDLDGTEPGGDQDPVERAFLDLAALLGVTVDPVARAAGRRATFRAGPAPQQVTTVDACRHGPTVTMRGLVEAVLPRCSQLLDDQGRGVPLSPDGRARLRRAAHRYGAQGLTVLAVAHRALGVGHSAPSERQEAETDLVLIGLVAMAGPLACSGT